MYDTRNQVALHQDENKRADIKAVKGAGLGKVNVAPANTRRALGDIGNVVAVAAVARGKEGPTEKVLLPAVDRPITRSFVAQLANNNHTKAEVKDVVSEKTSSKAPDVTESAVAAVDADLAKLLKDVPPGHPSRMKALLNGKSGRNLAVKDRKVKTLTATLTARSEAAGFKIKEEEPITDIDAGDVGNQLAVVDYVEDIYSFYKRAEVHSCVPADYMSCQAQINEKMRSVLVDWLIEVHFKFKLMPETLFLTTNLIDRYLAVMPVERKNLQLVGITAMLIASKYEEIWAPEINDFIFIADNAYTRQNILEMEKIMLNTLKFNLCIPTPYMFLVRFLKAAGSDQQMNMLAFYYVELCLVDYQMVRFSPSIQAAAAVYLARQTLKAGEEARWNATLKRHSGYKESQLTECVSMIVSLHQKAGEGNVTVVHRKYSQSKFCAVAQLKPPTIVSAQTDSK